MESHAAVDTAAQVNHAYVPALSPAMRAVERVIADIAPTDIPVLIEGESGTGKEVVAAQIHRLSLRRCELFTKVSCAALTPEFFSGRAHTGANGAESCGIFLLDEISELEPACQPKLLHVLPDGEALPLEGALATLGARVICTTSRNLEEEMRAGRFREDLYFRINGVCLRLPPLRHRKEDVPVLAHYFLSKYAAQFGRPQPKLSGYVLGQFAEYDWPGNIRELENAAKKIVALGDERAAVADLRARVAAQGNNGGAETLSLKDAARAASRHAERELILKVLGRTRWNRKRAAQELQISYKALLYKLKQIGLDDQAVS
ncbi:MAG: sigma 54-interacting transcriptional regulator [Acidobacteria bacterium]|nr:sigma 54-interacting transcriptional regulator [Acidobacteriota bacterium]